MLNEKKESNSSYVTFSEFEQVQLEYKKDEVIETIEVSSIWPVLYLSFSVTIMIVVFVLLGLCISFPCNI
jgi:hypothetical protein